jgi:Secretion system C-terminal sorting domain
MDVRLLAPFVVISFLSQAASAQVDSLSDIFPLSVGNQWIYDFEYSAAGMSHSQAVYDTGRATFTVTSETPFADSIVWTLHSSRNFSRTTYPDGGAFTISVQDSSDIEVVEKLEAHHQMYAIPWDPTGPFAFIDTDVDSIRFFRYVATDQSGQATFHTWIWPDQAQGATRNTYSLQSQVGMALTSYRLSTCCSWYGSNYYLRKFQILSIHSKPPGVAWEFVLHQNYPNPFNPTTTISFSIPLRTFVTIDIIDIVGRVAATVVSEELNAGSYERRWIASGMPSGMYFYRMRAGTYVETKKLLLIR